MERVVVIGGGITGCLVSFFLARHGMPVTLIEREGIGSQASGNNPGGINPLHGPGIPGPMSELAMRCHRLHSQNAMEIARLSGLDFQFHHISRIEVALDDKELLKLHNPFDSYNHVEGFSACWLDRAELADIDPRLSKNIVAGLLLRGNTNVNAHEYTAAVAEAARILGATMKEGEVVGIRYGNGRVTGVLLKDSEIECNAVVMATGPWIQGVNEWLGTRLPVIPVKGELLVVEMQPPALQHHFSRSLTGIYTLTDRITMLGGTREHAGFDTEPTNRGKDAILQDTGKIMPSVRKARLIRRMAALRPETPDGLPIIGKVPGFDNAFVATGAGPKGMLLSIGMAESITNMILGKEIELSLEAYRPDRFQ